MIRLNLLAEAFVLFAAAIGGVAALAQPDDNAPTRATGWLQPPATAAVTPPCPSPKPSSGAPPLRVAGRHFIDSVGRVVILRGVSLSGASKVPPFRACLDPTDLDRLTPLGLNVIRLLFSWEAYETLPGAYDDAYLAYLKVVARAAWERGMYVIVDFHQDGFSRHCSRGSGDGFPRWAVSPRGKPSVPDNSARCLHWPLLMAFDSTTHRSFDDFYSDAFGVRTRYLQMVARVAAAFAEAPGVIGYDLLNEPWGDEQRDLAPLYHAAAAAIRAGHPSAILFLEGQITTNCGIQTKLPRPSFGGAVYAPHYYKPLPIILGCWFGRRHNIDRAFDHMTATAKAWDAPLFLGEFGMPADLRNVTPYMTAIYDHLDACLASGAQWNYTPTWTEQSKDGWNGEDFSILDSNGVPRPNFRLRPYPRLTAGLPLHFSYRDADPAQAQQGPALEFVWAHCPERGDTEIFVPSALFAPGFALAVQPAEVSCQYDANRQVLICRVPRPSTIVLRLNGPIPGPRRP